MPTLDKREEGPRSISASLEPTTLDGGSGACLGAGTQLFFNVKGVNLSFHWQPWLYMLMSGPR